jgi:hypothetical protein
MVCYCSTKRTCCNFNIFLFLFLSPHSDLLLCYENEIFLKCLYGGEICVCWLKFPLGKKEVEGKLFKGAKRLTKLCHSILLV